MQHLDEAFEGHIDSIQGQLQRLDRTIGDLAQIQNSAAANTEQFSRILYGLFIVTAAVRFPQAPDSLTIKQLQIERPIENQVQEPMEANLISQPESEVVRYKPIPPQESIMRFSSTTRIQKPTVITPMRSFYMPITINYRG